MALFSLFQPERDARETGKKGFEKGHALPFPNLDDEFVTLRSLANKSSFYSFFLSRFFCCFPALNPLGQLSRDHVKPLLPWKKKKK